MEQNSLPLSKLLVPVLNPLLLRIFGNILCFSGKEKQIPT